MLLSELLYIVAATSTLTGDTINGSDASTLVSSFFAIC